MDLVRGEHHPVSTQRRAQLPSGEWPPPWSEHPAGVALSQTFRATSAGQGTLAVPLEAIGSPFSTGNPGGLLPSWAPGMERPGEDERCPRHGSGHAVSEGDGKGASWAVCSWGCLGLCRSPEGLPVFASSGQLRTGLVAEETAWHTRLAPLRHPCRHSKARGFLSRASLSPSRRDGRLRYGDRGQRAWSAEMWGPQAGGVQPEAGGWLPQLRWTGHHPLPRARLAVSPVGRRSILPATVRSRNGTSYLSHLPCGLVLLWGPRLLALRGAGLPL